MRNINYYVLIKPISTKKKSTQISNLLIPKINVAIIEMNEIDLPLPIDKGVYSKIFWIKGKPSLINFFSFQKDSCFDSLFNLVVYIFSFFNFPILDEKILSRWISIIKRYTIEQTYHVIIGCSNNKINESLVDRIAIENGPDRIEYFICRNDKSCIFELFRFMTEKYFNLIDFR